MFFVNIIIYYGMYVFCIIYYNTITLRKVSFCAIIIIKIEF